MDYITRDVGNMDLGKSSQCHNWHTYMFRWVYIDESKSGMRRTHDREHVEQGGHMTGDRQGRSNYKGMWVGELSTKHY
jgi:hypothetical protein